ncbi:MAG TPA: hypothetical protein VFU69_05220 [Ktedonobacterales bacterium]|nr:hypothetical protein [Ktedonobacterales bacterium]
MVLLLSYCCDCEDTMAESTREAATSRPKPKATTGAATTPKKAPAAKLDKGEALDRAIQDAKTGAPEAKSRFGFLSSLGSRLSGPKAASGDAAQGPAKPSMGKFFFGMSLYMVLALGAQFVLGFALPVSSRTQVLFTLPLLGPVTTYLLIWMLTLIAILYALYKFNILPRTLGQPRQKAAATKVDPKAKAAPTTRAPRVPVEGPDDDAYARVKARIRADRRKARRN